jgi:hypothetical protein
MELERIRRLTKEERESLNIDDLTMSDMKAVIEETILSETNVKIAKLRFLKLKNAEKIGEILGYDSRTVAARIKFIKERFKNTIINI